MIVILDDSPIQRQVIRHVVKESGVLYPDSPEEIAELEKTLDPKDVECILVDRVMPDDWEKAAISFISKFPLAKRIEWTICTDEKVFARRVNVDDRLKKTGTGEEIKQFIRNLRGTDSRGILSSLMLPFAKLFVH